MSELGLFPLGIVLLPSEQIPLHIFEDRYRVLVRELILIAQDTTDYGHDLGMKDGLAILLEQITTSVPDMDWIRVMYAYPGYVTDRLIDVMASSRQVLPYLDMPLQHASAAVLKPPSGMITSA